MQKTFMVSRVIKETYVVIAPSTSYASSSGEPLPWTFSFNVLISFFHAWNKPLKV
jgi:hypothetical protein